MGWIEIQPVKILERLILNQPNRFDEAVLVLAVKKGPGKSTLTINLGTKYILLCILYRTKPFLT